MTPDSGVPKNTFKQIFSDGWEAFKRAHPRYAAVDPVVQKMLGLDQTVMYNYRCGRCQYEDAVPDVVIDGFVVSSGCRPGQMPRLVCPNCGGAFRYRGRTKRERSER